MTCANCSGTGRDFECPWPRECAVCEGRGYLRRCDGSDAPLRCALLIVNLT